MTNELGSCVARCALVLVVGLSVTTAASGQTAWGCGGTYYPSYGYAYLPPIPLRADQPVPYYAVHPPVYYSHVVRRPYGYSPYADVPGVVAPGLAGWGIWRQARPVGGQDFGPQRLAPPPEADREEATRPERQAASRAPSPSPAVIENPYVDAELAGSAESRTGARPPRKVANPYCEGKKSDDRGLSGAAGDDREGTAKIIFPVAAAGAGG